MNQSESINELITALSKAQGEMSTASKDCNNPFFKSKYADLSSVWAACREPLSKHGLAVIQTVQQRECGDVLFTMLGHSSGQWISSTMPIRIKMEGKGGNELQALGAAITYLRRFALSALVGVAPDDDNDANTATAYKNNEAIAVVAPISPKTISSQQATELREIISRCSPGFKKYISEFLKKGQIRDLSGLPEVLLENLTNQSLQDAKSFQEPSNQEKIA
jgi:hypothetical protein